MPTVRQRRLATDLRTLREQAGLKPEDVAERLGISESTVRRAERPGATLPKEGVLRGLLGLYGADEAITARLIEVRREAKQHQRGWWIGYTDVIDPSYVTLEEGASNIRTWQNMFVPGLLQTEDYARAVIEAIHPGDPGNSRRVEARMMRRTRFNLRATPAWLHALIDESVLHRKVGSDETMWEQISDLRKASRRSNVTIQIVPLETGAHPGMASSFVLMGFADDGADTAFVEAGRAGDLYPEDEPALAGFNIDWGRIQGVALTPEESAERLAGLLEG